VGGWDGVMGGRTGPVVGWVVVAAGWELCTGDGFGC